MWERKKNVRKNSATKTSIKKVIILDINKIDAICLQQKNEISTVIWYLFKDWAYANSGNMKYKTQLPNIFVVS